MPALSPRTEKHLRRLLAALLALAALAWLTLGRAEMLHLRLIAMATSSLLAWVITQRWVAPISNLPLRAALMGGVGGMAGLMAAGIALLLLAIQVAQQAEIYAAPAAPQALIILQQAPIWAAGGGLIGLGFGLLWWGWSQWPSPPPA